MKILIVSEDIPQPHLGGLGKHALALARELQRRNHEVDVLGNAEHAIADHPEQALTGRFIAAIRGHQRGWGQSRIGAFHPWAHRLRAGALAHAIRTHAAGYDVVHYHGHLPWVGGLLPAALPFTQTRHDQGGDCMLYTRFRPEGVRCETRDPRDCAGCATPAPNALQRASSAWSVRRMRADTASTYAERPVIFVSGFLREAFAKVSPQGVQGEVIHNAIDTQVLQSALAAMPAEPPGRWLVELFTAGAFNAYKGFGALLDELARQGLPADWRLTLAGDGPELAGLCQRHAAPSLRFLGWCDYATVLAHTARADAVVVPSVWDEPCATTVMEALALGRTVYALRRGGTSELAVHAGPQGVRLCLFDTMQELVAALRCHQGHAPDAAASLKHFGGTIEAMADLVLVHYAKHFASRGPAAL